MVILPDESIMIDPFSYGDKIACIECRKDLVESQLGICSPRYLLDRIGWRAQVKMRQANVRNTVY